MKSSFLNQNRPLVCAMVLKDNPDAIKYRIKNSIYAGADALGIQLCRLQREYKTEEHYKSIFSACGSRPIYVTNYRYCCNEGMSDEECMDGLKLALSCGGTLADIMGDTFDKTEGELTESADAISRQISLIDEIHDMGKEVLMSSHVYKFIPAEKVVEIALEHQRRGADISKIVTGANSDEEMLENFRATVMLKKELNIPFLFLSGGTHTKLHRMIGPQLGCCMYLAVYEHDENAVATQPTVAAAKAVRDNLDFAPDIV
ncbi:MAG: type I 3-dehydroquinate dehydratase [Acutalibacteraceae bacterium]|nr:type I 3-dehydroquinate dehydratase [Acutalibacteraceae bacterium]